MLPVLLRLNGSVQVSGSGDMLYAFPELQRRAAQGGSQGSLRGAFRAAVAWVEDKAQGKSPAEQPFLARQGAPPPQSPCVCVPVPAQPLPCQPGHSRSRWHDAVPQPRRSCPQVHERLFTDSSSCRHTGVPGGEADAGV